MNVVLGGSLWQDLPSQRGVNHRDTVHYVDIVKESLLYKATGLERAQVNSFHHQAAKDIAPGAKITATAEDGTIEGFEYGDGQVIAVQFHPEVLAAQDTSWLSIFRYFTNLCK